MVDLENRVQGEETAFQRSKWRCRFQVNRKIGTLLLL
tara:strand:- start:89 stop:199 length:111 start_codon:yes stop_codon:yes gene_type:complete